MVRSGSGGQDQGGSIGQGDLGDAGVPSGPGVPGSQGSQGGQLAKELL